MLPLSQRQPLPAGRSRLSSSAPVNSRLRTKRAGQSVDTNLASYDRTDPYTAFDALRKILGGCPSKGSGGAFKLSPEEQKLSMHLLTIVEPFIGNASSRHTLTHQPNEILDAIVSHLESKRDLLSLALSCKRMHDVIFPRHLEYFVVRCKVSHVSVWRHLAVNRALAQNVRRLEILDERSTDTVLVPSDVNVSDSETDSSDEESRLNVHDKQGRFFSAALSKMTGLVEFVWSCNHSLIQLQNIWPILLKCESLRSVGISDNLIFSPVAYEGGLTKSEHSEMLSHVSTVAVSSIKKGYGQNKNPELSRVTDMLHHCPNLEELAINYNAPNGFASPRADDFFLYGSWPHLRSLTLTHLVCTPEGLAAAAAFLRMHTAIEVLNLDIGPGRAGIHIASAFGAAAGALPRLRELRTPSKELACAIMSCPVDTPRPLETVKGMRLGGHAKDAEFFECLRQYSIKRVELVGYSEFEDLRKLVESVPKVSWLDIGKKANAAPRTGPENTSYLVEWAELLSQLPELTTFHGVRLVYKSTVNNTAAHCDTTNTTLSDRSIMKKNDEIASLISWKCPKLRRLDHWDQHPGKVLVLVKDGEKTRWETRRVKL